MTTQGKPCCECPAGACKDLTKLIVNSDSEREINKLPITIDENRVIEGAIEILRVIRPHWDLERVHFKMFTDGITNKLVGCFYQSKEDEGQRDDNDTNHQQPTPQMNGNNHAGATDAVSESANENTETVKTSIFDTTDPENVVLVRVYGNKTDMLIDRKAETRNIRLMHQHGFAPQLFAIFKNGLAYEFIPGETLNPQKVRLPEVWRLVAVRMAQMHKIDCGPKVAKTPMLPSTMEKFFNLVPNVFSDPVKHERLKDTFLPIQKLRDDFADLLARLEKLQSPVVFAHNDLLLTNIIYTESLNRVTFIDYEYAAYNFQAFDIGNHFAEFAGVDEVDYSRYPSKEFQLNWLRVYLEEYQSPGQVTEKDVERLYVAVNQFALAAHYLWIVWGLIQAEYSTIDFNYAEYALMRYKEYLAKRDQFLSLEYKD